MDEESSLSSEEEYSTADSDVESSSCSQSENFEIAKICGNKFQLPQELCENKNVFKEFFSVHMWNSLSESHRQHLKNFLPHFPENDNAEKNVTLQKLFTGEKIGFESPLERFYSNIQEGQFRPDVSRLRHMIRRAQRRESKCQQKRYIGDLVRKVLTSRQWLLNTANSLPPAAMQTTRLAPPVSPSSKDMEVEVAQRAKKRYFQELSAIRTEVGESNEWSEDENYPEGPDLQNISKSKQRRLSAFSPVSGGPPSPGAEQNVVSTFMSRAKPQYQSVTTNHTDVQINYEKYRSMLIKHKRRRSENTEHTELKTEGIHLRDIASRTLLSVNNKKALLNLHKSVSQHLVEPKVSTKKHSKKHDRENKTISTPPVMAAPQVQINSKSNNNSYCTTPNSNLLGHSSNSELDMSDESLIDPVMSPAPMKSSSNRVRTPVSIQKQNQNHVSSPNSNCVIIPPPLPSTESISNIKVIKTEQPISLINNKVVTIEPPKLSTSLPTSGFNMITSISQYGGKVTPATLSDLEGIDMLNLPVDLDDSNIGILDEISQKTPELMQETHASFFSLIRDIICSTSDQRMSYNMLEAKLKVWQENPISPLNDWYNMVDNWVEALPCVVSFLHGDFPEQPDEFVPYLELKPNVQEYQWIGAGRDSDNLLLPLFQYWLEHREEMTTEKTTLVQEIEVEHNEIPKSPPPPRWPTTWVVRKAEPEEIDVFREQERQRYENPHRAFTYRMNGYESVVGPVKGIYSQNAGIAKARGHSMLNSNRPNFVTILTLVRDATARLPNGEGTRADICELLKSSQYISQDATDSVLQSVVSGALDRMHTEYDPCVKYDTKRKIWIYLHRNRTESEFEKIHQQHQGMSRHQKKNNSRKPKTRTKVDKTAAAKTDNETNTTNSVAEVSTTTKRFKVPACRVNTSVTTTTVSTTVASPVIMTSTILSESNKTPAGTSLLINQQTKQSLINKNILEKVQSPSSIKVLSPQSLLSNQLPSKSSTVTTTAQTLQSIISPRVNSPVLKSIQITGAKTINKGIVKIVNAPTAQGKSLINQSALLTNQQNPILLKQHIVTSAKNQQPNVQTTSISIKTTNTDTQQRQQTLIATTPNQNVLSSQIQGKQAVTTRQILQTITSQLPQPIIQTMTPQLQTNQKVLQTTGKQVGKTTVATLTPAQQQLLQCIQNIKQGKGVVTQQPNATVAVLNNQQQQALLKQQVALQQFQKQLQQQQQQQQTVKAGTVTATSLLDQPRLQLTTNKPATGTTANVQAPLVAKVLTNAAGQVISVESLLAHQKQHGSLPQGTTLRVAGGKLSQANLIQLAGTVPNQVTTQFAVVSQGNIVASTSGQTQRVIASVAQPGTSTIQTSTTPQIIVAGPAKGIANVKGAIRQTAPQQVNIQAKLAGTTANKLTHQLINAKFITTPQSPGTIRATNAKQITKQTVPAVTSKVIANKTTLLGSVPTTTTAIRMVNSAGLNFTHITGKPILLASKGNTIQGQNIILRGQSNAQGMAQGSSLVIASNQQARQQNTVNISTQNNQIMLGTPVKLQGLIDSQAGNKGVDGNTVILSTQQSQDSASGSTTVPTQRVVLAASQTPGGQLLTQQILLPQGFQGGTINIKTLQGLKVIPLPQQAKGVTNARQQVFTRLLSPVSLASAETVTPTITQASANTTNSQSTESR